MDYFVGEDQFIEKQPVLRSPVLCTGRRGCEEPLVKKFGGDASGS